MKLILRQGKWAYLYRALDKDGNTIDFYLSSTRSINAARSFLSKALEFMEKYAHPKTINTDRNPTYSKAIVKLKRKFTSFRVRTQTGSECKL